MTCSLQTFQFGMKQRVKGKQEQECIRVGITIFKMFISAGMSFGHTVINHILRLRSRVTVKLNSPNENFEYRYPLIFSKQGFNLRKKNVRKLCCNSELTKMVCLGTLVAIEGVTAVLL